MGGVLGRGSEFLGERIVRALFIPKDIDDPPALAIKSHLKTVDAAGERRFARGVAGFVAAEDLRDVAEGLHAADDGLFEETVFQKIGAAEADVVFDGVWADANCAIGSFFGGGEARVGHEERAEAVPIAFAGGAGDDVVESGEEAFDGFDVVRFCGRDVGKRIGGGLRGSGVLLSGGFFGGGLGGGGCVRNGESCG